MSKEKVFLLALHFCSKNILREFKKIRRATEEMGASFLLYHQRENECVSHQILNQPHYIITDSMLSKIGYAPFQGNLIPGRTIFLLMQFFRQYQYKYYWFIEYDVRFTGDWKGFFSHFDKRDEDFLAAHIRRYPDEPDWYWWQGLSHPKENVELSKRLRAFCPIYRISWPALKCIDEMYKRQWSGHQECLLPTLLCHAGFKLGDFGGNGEFVLPGDKNRFYIDSNTSALFDGSLRFLNPFLCLFNKPRDKLYHPVKEGAKIKFLKILFTKTLAYRFLYKPLKEFLKRYLKRA